jgi:hypothetical protein
VSFADAFSIAFGLSSVFFLPLCLSASLLSVKFSVVSRLWTVDDILPFCLNPFLYTVKLLQTAIQLKRGTTHSLLANTQYVTFLPLCLHALFICYQLTVNGLQFSTFAFLPYALKHSSIVYSQLTFHRHLPNLKNSILDSINSQPCNISHTHFTHNSSPITFYGSVTQKNFFSYF